MKIYSNYAFHKQLLVCETYPKLKIDHDERELLKINPNLVTMYVRKCLQNTMFVIFGKKRKIVAPKSTRRRDKNILRLSKKQLSLSTGITTREYVDK